jgi:hypothetical protein
LHSICPISQNIFQPTRSSSSALKFFWWKFYTFYTVVTEFSSILGFISKFWSTISLSCEACVAGWPICFYFINFMALYLIWVIPFLFYSIFRNCAFFNSAVSCGLVVIVPGYRSGGPGSIPGATTFSEK